jgi:transcriptional regulator with XRE-family HTH domain
MLDNTPRDLRLETPAPANAVVKASFPSEAASNRSPTSADGNVGRRIKEFRRLQGFTQKQIAERVGVTGAQFHRYETGATRIATSRLLAIATALGVQPERLMSDPLPVVAKQPVGEATTTGGLVELVELYSSLVDQRRRAAMLSFARSLASSSEGAAVARED